MTSAPGLTDDEVARLRAVAVALVPGQGPSPPAGAIEDLDALLRRAAVAFGAELVALRAAIEALPEPIDTVTLEELSEREGWAFDLVSTAAVGAYFMSSTVLDSLGYPQGPRSAPPFDLAAEELETGILEPVMALAPMWRSPEHVEREA